ncbi:uncharacterized protein [Elaeis guineensis]|uniref:uncharacterized protein n=1 Tax=Elaeis guineensis var. tenera TaxID=51953 RepID=UPI00094FB56F
MGKMMKMSKKSWSAASRLAITVRGIGWLLRGVGRTATCFTLTWRTPRQNASSSPPLCGMICSTSGPVASWYEGRIMVSIRLKKSRNLRSGSRHLLMAQRWRCRRIRSEKNGEGGKGTETRIFHLGWRDPHPSAITELAVVRPGPFFRLGKQLTAEGSTPLSFDRQDYRNLPRFRVPSFLHVQLRTVNLTLEKKGEEIDQASSIPGDLSSLICAKVHHHSPASPIPPSRSQLDRIFIIVS